jgi:hypothetical protein
VEGYANSLRSFPSNGAGRGADLALGLLWLAADPLFIKRDRDPSDMIATIMVEDAFDIGE